MEFLEAEPANAAEQLRALAVVGREATNGLGQPQRALADAWQHLVLATQLDVDGVDAITPDELAASLRDPARRRQLVRWMVALALADGPPSRAQVARIRAFAEALGVEEPSVGVVSHLAEGRVRRFRVAFFRRSHVRAYLRNTRQMLGGVPPTIRAILVARGVLGENRELAARFHALADLPEGTLGRCFHDHCRAEGLAFPGEKGGFPIGALFHDFSHVLAGYDTSPEGELKNAAFQAGFTRDENDFFTALFAIVIHTAGVNLAPFPMPVLPGRIGQGRLAFDVVHAWRRGAAMPIDLGDGWDFWDDVERPIAEARERLGVPPPEFGLPVAH